MTPRLHSLASFPGNWKHGYTGIYTWMFAAALFLTDKRQKQPKCPSADEWIHETWLVKPRRGILFEHKKARPAQTLLKTLSLSPPVSLSKIKKYIFKIIIIIIKKKKKARETPSVRPDMEGAWKLSLQPGEETAERSKHQPLFLHPSDNPGHRASRYPPNWRDRQTDTRNADLAEQEPVNRNLH